MRAILVPTIATSRTSDNFCEGSMTRPPAISRSKFSACPNTGCVRTAAQTPEESSAARCSHARIGHPPHGRCQSWSKTVNPSFAKEGWTRPKENAAKPPLRSGRGGCFKQPLNRWLETTTPSAPTKERGFFSLWRSHPSFAKEGFTVSRNRIISRTPDRYSGHLLPAFSGKHTL